MFGFGDAVLIEDEFLRDGLQNEARVLSLAEKLGFVRGLEEAGLRRIQLGSFVKPSRVPQMADTDALFAALERRPGVTYSALVLNMAGLERALAVAVPHLSISVSASESHSRANLNKSIDEALAGIAPVIERALAAGVAVRAGIQSAFGCGYEGRVAPERVVAIARSFSALGVHEINLADTAGLGNPRQVFELVGAVRDVVRPQAALSLHLHDTRGLGLANMVAGLQAGVRIFDAALGGLGGCPFIPAASGNIATEDAVFALEEMGLSTGIDWQALATLARRLEGLLGRRLPGRMAHIAAPEGATR
ncbi:hydroxymethylglutaryl-CoA lyase [Devosia sp.]|uniref:hydroxymethylglutaryl-CoA lyase n=1 Tax=Devosia sp. TaxID=1871048 RepID=UPI002EE7F706